MAKTRKQEKSGKKERTSSKEKGKRKDEIEETENGAGRGDEQEIIRQESVDAERRGDQT